METLNTTDASETGCPPIAWTSGDADARERVGTLSLALEVKVSARWRPDDVPGSLDYLGQFVERRKRGAIDVTEREGWYDDLSPRYWVPSPGKYDKIDPERIAEHGSVEAARQALIEGDLEEHLRYLRGDKSTWNCTVTLSLGSLSTTAHESSVFDPFVDDYDLEVAERLAEEALEKLEGLAVGRLEVR